MSEDEANCILRDIHRRTGDTFADICFLQDLLDENLKAVASLDQHLLLYLKGGNMPRNHASIAAKSHARLEKVCGMISRAVEPLELLAAGKDSFECDSTHDFSEVVGVVADAMNVHNDFTWNLTPSGAISGPLREIEHHLMHFFALAQKNRDVDMPSFVGPS